MGNKKPFNGKAIYVPQGKAGEYSQWACNFYTGCSNLCDYCYCRKGVMSHVFTETPQLKKCFKSIDHAIEVFTCELEKNLSEIQRHGLFFSFTTDPLLPDTCEATARATVQALAHDVPCMFLTKCVDMIPTFANPFIEIDNDMARKFKSMLAFGFTLTGHDELEPNASSNSERWRTMKILYEKGFPVFASIEPIITFKASLWQMQNASEFCNLFKVGTISGKKYPESERADAIEMLEWMKSIKPHSSLPSYGPRFYLKDSFVKYLGIDREELMKEYPQFVSSTYNIFTKK